MSRSFSRLSRASSVLPSTTTSTSNSVAGKRLVTASYCRYSLELERNNWRQRIVDLDALDAEDRGDDQRDQNDAGQDRRLDRDQPDALQPEGDAGPCGRCSILLDMDLTVACSFRACPVQFSDRRNLSSLGSGARMTANLIGHVIGASP